MARSWVSLHGHKYGYPGIIHCPDKLESGPWRVKYIRSRRYVNVGHFTNLRLAQAAARDFLRKEKISLDNVI